jgi:tetratricopeptide (TPR) repeat protein
LRPAPRQCPSSRDRGGPRRATQALLAAALSAWVVACASQPTQDERATVDASVAPIVKRAEESRAVGAFDQAIADYTIAFERTPWNTRLRRAIAVTHTEKAERARNEGKLDVAETDLRAALGLYPEESEFRQNLAALLVERAQLTPDPATRAGMVEEARSLAPQLGVPERVLFAPLERQLDLAYGLLTEGKIDSGVSELERICRDFPNDVGARRLLAQARVAQASELAQRTNFSGAAASLDRAIELYAALPPCDDGSCDPDAPRVAHYNRIIVRMNASQPDLAREALADARARGFSFPALEAELERIDGR